MRPHLDYAVITKHWWCVPTMLVLLRLTQKDYELEAPEWILDYHRLQRKSSIENQGISKEWSESLG